MDYKKIYKDFIDERKAKGYPASTYTERHHIIPRCMLGSNANNNLVRLSYRDHVFAHALLLKGAADEWERWHMAASMSAVLNFDGSGQRPAEERAFLDKKYAWARRLHGKTITGKNHPGYNHKRITLWNTETGEEIKDTRQGLIKRTGLPFRAIYDMANSKRTYFSEWCSDEEEANNRYRSNRIFETRHERIDKNIFHNIDGRVVDTKKHSAQHLNEMGLCKNTRSIARRKGYCKGWCVDEMEAKMRSEGRWYKYEKKQFFTNELENNLF